MKRIIMLLLALFTLMSLSNAQTDFTLTSPDKRITVDVTLKGKIYYKVSYKDDALMMFSPLTMTLGDGTVLGENPVLEDKFTKLVEDKIKTVWGTKSEVKENYKELKLNLEGGYSVVFRAYNDGVAYRFITNIKGDIIVKNEEVAYRFAEDHDVMLHIVGTYQSSYEKTYTKTTISKMNEKDFSSLPIIVQANNDVKIAITEADLYDYPGMYLNRLNANNRKDILGTFPKYPTKWVKGGWCQFSLHVTERADYIAKTTGTRNFPWRVMIIANEDKKLADNDMVYKLSRSLAIDPSWIRPGKVAWDWWNDWNLEGVDFESGINNKTYEYYIDFASKNNIPYVIMDEGWSDQFDMTLERPNIDVQHLAEYAAERNVKLILWCIGYVFDKQMETVLPMFKEWGIAGVKVDFFDRDDQIMINTYERMARECAKYNMLIDYHGCSKPTGLHRMYPNIVNYEAVRGNEYNKFNTDETPEHNLNIAFIRMLCGPMDYTPGAMRNSAKGDFRTSNSMTMSYGTRCHQLGMFINYHAPLQMLCDAPTEYEKYPDILHYLSKVPVTWDETIVLDAKLGEYLIVARRKGKEWYIGGMNDWNEREVDVNLYFLNSGNFTAEILKDGINANKRASDYQFEKTSVNNNSKFKITMKQGGGFAIRIY